MIPGPPAEGLLEVGRPSEKLRTVCLPSLSHMPSHALIAMMRGALQKERPRLAGPYEAVRYVRRETCNEAERSHLETCSHRCHEHNIDVPRASNSTRQRQSSLSFRCPGPNSPRGGAHRHTHHLTHPLRSHSVSLSLFLIWVLRTVQSPLHVLLPWSKSAQARNVLQQRWKTRRCS
jgi:hypothetical protein